MLPHIVLSKTIPGQYEISVLLRPACKGFFAPMPMKKEAESYKT
jgi:hypothetical protein